MQPWQTLTPRGKLLRLRQTALTALREYDLEIKRLRIVGSFTNLVLRADDSAGRAWMVRVCAPNWRTDTDIAAEMSWLAFLQHSDIPAPVRF